MGKRMEEILKKELKTLHNQLEKDKNSISELYEAFDKARFIAKCRSCDKELAYSKMIFAKRYTSCRLVETCNLVSQIAGKIKMAEKQEAGIREAYGEKLFNILAEYQPVLTHTKENAEVMWNDVFGSDYAKLSEEKKVSLIGLIELDGGLYRLKNIGPIFE